MNVFDFIKNPAKYIWGDFKKKEVTIGKEFKRSINSHNRGFVKTKSAYFTLGKDFVGSFNRGKQGTLIKILLAILFILYILNLFVSPQKPSTVEKPPVEDPGDLLKLPDFKNVDYISSSIDSDGKYLVYSSVLNQVNKFGVRGILLDSINTDFSFRYYFPIQKTFYKEVESLKYEVPIFKNNSPKPFLIYLGINKDGSLILKYLLKKEYKKYQDTLYYYIPKEKILFKNISDYRELKNIHKTAQGYVSFIYKNTFYVLDPYSGSYVKKYNISDSSTSMYTFFNNEIYFLKRTSNVDSNKNAYYLVKYNKYDKEVYSLLLGSLKPHKLYILSANRYLLVYEYPSKYSFFKIELIDSLNNKLLTLIPKEKGDRLLKLNQAYYNDKDKNILLLGGGIVKLFNSSGTQLWMH